MLNASTDRYRYSGAIMGTPIVISASQQSVRSSKSFFDFVTKTSAQWPQYLIPCSFSASRTLCKVFRYLLSLFNAFIIHFGRIIIIMYDIVKQIINFFESRINKTNCYPIHWLVYSICISYKKVGILKSFCHKHFKWLFKTWYVKYKTAAVFISKFTIKML